MRRSSVAKGAGSVSIVATAMPLQASIIVVSAPPNSTPVSGLPTRCGCQSSFIVATPLRTPTTCRPSALFCGMVSENHAWNIASAFSGMVSNTDFGWSVMALVLQPHLARREIFHDLQRAAADCHHLGLAVDALDLRAAQVTRPAEDLHRLVGDVFQGCRRE